MKYLLTIAIAALFSLASFAQVEGVILYEEPIKLDIKFEGMPDEVKDLIPQSQTLKKRLIFNNEHSIYINDESELLEDQNIGTEEVQVVIEFFQDDVEDIMYISRKDNQVTHQKGIMGKPFIVDSELEKYSWKLTNEKIKYLGYECQKAFIESDDEYIVAWYTSQIPTQIGPGSYNGLPGAILLVSINNGEREIKATSVILTELDDSLIIPPTNGKRVSNEEFEKIKERKIKELKQMNSGNTSRRVIRQ